MRDYHLIISLSERLSFNNFPFNFLYGFDNNQYTSPNQYITIWKYLIYNAVCKMMANNEGLPRMLLDVLRKIYSQEPIKVLKRAVSKWTASDFGIEFLGCGLKIEGGSKEGENLTWIKKVNIFEDIIGEYGKDGTSYYILIDELDEDYRDFENETQKRTYINLLTSLFKAVQDIRACFKDTSVNIRPIIFLRSDIYSIIKDPDKNKWGEYIVNLSWTPESLYKMLCHRLFVSTDRSIPKEKVWSVIFPQPYVFMGNCGRKKMKTFQYMTRSTQWRPRDYIHYIAECGKLSIAKDESVVSSVTVKEVDREFSEYLKREIIDEIFAVLPCIDQVFNTISQIRKQTFSPQEFLAAYKNCGKTEEEGKFVLTQLFEYGVIGNQPAMRNQQIFKYQYPNTLFNFEENMIIHRGLYKALQIF